MYSDIFRVCDHSLLPKHYSFRSDSLPPDWADSSDRCECAAALLLPFGLVEICDALLSYDMADVVAVNHDRGDWHPCLLADLHRVECVNECGNAAFLKGLYSLYYELSTA